MIRPMVHPVHRNLALPVLLWAFWSCATAVEEPAVLLQESARLLAAGHREEAESVAARARRLWPERSDCALTWIYAAKELALAGPDHDLLDETEALCRDLGENDPNAVEPWFALGLVRRDRGDLAGAVQAWQEARARDPYHERTLRLYADLEYSLGRERAAALLYRELQRIPPPRAEDSFRLGVCGVAQAQARPEPVPADLEGPERCFREALELDPGHSGARRGLAWLEVHRSRLLGRWAEPDLKEEDGTRAMALLVPLLDKEVPDPEALHDQAWILAELGRREEAEGRYREALATDPWQVASLVDLAFLLDAAGGAPGAEAAELRRRAMASCQDARLEQALRRSLGPVTGR